MAHSVLVVDDEKTFLQSLTKSLTDNGYKVTTAENGQDAYALLEARAQQHGTTNINVILSDWQMPNGTGLELLSRIRNGPHRAIAFVLMSGAVSREELQGAASLGPDGVILKPFDMKTLCLKLEQAIQKREEIEVNNFLKDLK